MPLVTGSGSDSVGRSPQSWPHLDLALSELQKAVSARASAES